MDKKTVLTKIAELFTAPEVETEDVINFVDVKAIDGRIFRVTEMVVDAEIKEITEDGEIDVEAGELKLEEGVVLVIEQGKIKEIYQEEEVEEEVQEETEEVEVEMSSDEPVEEVVEEEIVAEEETDSEVDTLINNIKNLIDQVNVLQEGFNSLIKENEELKTKVETFAKLPSEEPTKTKMEFNNPKKKTYLHSYIENKK